MPLRSRRAALVTAGVSALVLALAGYVALDVTDTVPGPLTSRPLVTPTLPAPPGPTVTQPVAAPSTAPLTAAGSGAPVPTTAGLRTALASSLADPRLGSSPGVAIRDAASGAHLLDVGADQPRIPASTTKLLSGAAIAATLGVTARFTTSVVQGATAHDVVLVAGGDTLVAPGAGDPTAVVGHAGYGDLATTTAAALKKAGATSVRVGLDLTHAPGPTQASTWGSDYVASGITGAVAAIGLSTLRVVPGRVGPKDPTAPALAAFAAALRQDGLTVTTVGRVTAPTGAAVLASARSATVGQLLALALQDSDDALTEVLAREAAFHAGVAQPGFAAVGAWVRRTLAGLGVDVTGVTMVDASGLSRGDVVPPRVVADVLALAATSTRLPAWRDTVSQLAIGGLSGTLADRFDASDVPAGAGIVRAKTGTLTGVSALAGTLVTRSGRLLTFTLIANGVPTGTGTTGARDALDDVVGVLASCGCR